MANPSAKGTMDGYTGLTTLCLTEVVQIPICGQMFQITPPPNCTLRLGCKTQQVNNAFCSLQGIGNPYSGQAFFSFMVTSTYENGDACKGTFIGWLDMV